MRAGRLILAGALALSLSACATATMRQNAEKVDVVALNAYASVAASVNTYEAMPGRTDAEKASAEAVRTKAWTLLAQEHALYQSGVVADISALMALVQTAANLGK